MGASLSTLLLTGLIGAFAAGIINHFYRRREARLDREAQEQKSAYIYMTSLLRITANCDALIRVSKPFLALYGGNINKFREVFPKDQRANVTDEKLACAVFNIGFEAMKENQEPNKQLLFKRRIEVLHSQADAAFNFVLTPDQLRRLPRRVAVKYSAFEVSLQTFRTQLDVFCRSVFEGFNLGAYGVFCMWVASKELYNFTNELIEELRRTAGISKHDYDLAYANLMNVMLTNFSQTSFAEDSLEKIEQAIRPLAEKNLAEAAVKHASS